MRGRKPIPTAIKLAHGNPGHRPLNDQEPSHEALPTECPEELTDPVARVEWDRVASDLSSSGQATKMDRTILIGYCLKYAQWKSLEEEATKHPFVVKAPSGYPIPNPALGMANKVFGLMLKAAAELGITPSSRSRVKAKPVEQNDTFESRQRSRPVLVVK